MPPLADLLGESPAIRAVRATVERLLAHGVEGRRLPPLLIQGETGTGKGLLARAIHRAGPRSAGPLVEVNCAAIPETLLEAELFGFERGAFTDARQPKAGLFQTAHQGTLFLDEIGLLPEGVQAKLLKVLEDHAVRRLGSTRSEPADVALIAATSEDLRDGVRARRFREDLYHRLAVVTVQLPPLAERGPDILLLAEHFLARACADYGLAEKRLTPDARAALCAYAWPGNIRELANVMERAALLTDSAVVTAAVLGLPTLAGLETTEPGPDEKPRPFRDAMGTIERVQLLEVLNDTQWNIVRAAARLQIPRGTLRYRIEKLGLTRSGVPPARAAPSVARTSPEPLAPPRAGPPRSAEPWERRQLAFLRAALVPSSDRDASVEIGKAPQVLVEKAESFGGHVEALGPLGLIAAFGLEPVEDAPRRAAHAAIAMRKAVERASPTVGTKIAIHASQGLVGQRADGAVIDVTATSEAYVTLEALLKDAERDAIVVSPAVARALERRFTLAPISQPAGGPGYRLEGLEQPGLTPRGGMTPLVGRESELEQVHRALARAEAGHGQVVALVGEPGVGKSRLVWEIAHAHRAHGWLVLQAGAVSYGTATPYLPVVNLLRGYFQIGDQDEPRAIREKVTQKLLALDQALEPTLPAILALLDAPVEDPGWETLSPQERRQRTINALKQLLLRESQVQPLLVGRRGSPLDRRGDAGRARPAGREPAGGPAPVARQLPPRVPARLEREDLLPPAPARPPPAGAGERAPGNAPRRRRRPRAAQAAPSRTDRGQPLLPRGGRAEPRGRRRAAGRPRRLSAREGSGGLRRAGDGPGDPGRAHRPPAARTTGTSSRSPRSSAPRSRSRCSRRSPDEPRTPWPMGSPASSPPSSCTRRAWSRTRFTPSSMPSPTRWPTRACSTSDDARSMPGSWRRSRRSIPIASPSTSSGSRTTPSGARPGKRRSPTFGRPALKRPRALGQPGGGRPVRTSAGGPREASRSRGSAGASGRRPAPTPKRTHARSPSTDGCSIISAAPRALAETLGDQHRLVRVSGYMGQCLRWLGDLEQAARSWPSGTSGWPKPSATGSFRPRRLCTSAGIHHARGEYLAGDGAPQIDPRSPQGATRNPRLPWDGGPSSGAFRTSGSRWASPSSGSFPKRSFTARKRSGSRRRRDSRILLAWRTGDSVRASASGETSPRRSRSSSALASSARAWQYPGPSPLGHAAELGDVYALSGACRGASPCCDKAA